MVDAVAVPVIAAGGIGDGAASRRFRAGRGGGADRHGLSAAPEATTRRCIAPRSPRRETTRTRADEPVHRRPARSLVNRLIREVGPVSDDAPAFPLGARPLLPYAPPPKNRASGDFSSLWSGEAGALAKAEDAGEATRQFWREAQAAMGALAARRA